MTVCRVQELEAGAGQKSWVQSQTPFLNPRRETGFCAQELEVGAARRAGCRVRP